MVYTDRDAGLKANPNALGPVTGRSHFKNGLLPLRHGLWVAKPHTVI
jgi:hypothetical protein